MEQNVQLFFKTNYCQLPWLQTWFETFLKIKTRLITHNLQKQKLNSFKIYEKTPKTKWSAMWLFDYFSAPMFIFVHKPFKLGQVPACEPRSIVNWPMVSLTI